MTPSAQPDAASGGPRVVVVGARRRRQGIGAFVARYLQAAGAVLCGVVGTTRGSAEEACRQLRGAASGGRVGPNAYVDLDAALREEEPEIVAICSPYLHHRAALEVVLRHARHCLCEKPLWWNGDLDVEADTRALARAFRDRGRLLSLVTQWPWTIEDFFRLHPRVRGQRLERFDMLLSPTSEGDDMVVDAAPHLLSMLQHILGSGDIEQERVDYFGESRQSLCLTFTYVHGTGATDVTFQCTRCAAPPRPAAYALNGHWVRRRVELPGYRLFLEADGQTVPIRDPLEKLVKDFLRNVEQATPTDELQLVDGMRFLARLVALARR
jgi:predicted dehydrogenase